MNTKKLALAAVLSAFGVVCLLTGSFFSVLDLSAAAIAGLVIVIAVIELQGSYPVLIYITISVLSILILPNKYPAVFFIFFGGFYPILKAYIERFHNIVAWVVKFSMFNTFLALLVMLINILADRGFLPPVNDFENSSLSGFLEKFEIIVFIVANFVFLLYDIAMTKIITLYIVKIRKLLGFKNYF